QGHNLSSDDSGNLSAPGDMPNTDPRLGSLQENGGPTPTMALLPGSPGIDAGALTDSEWDQRGPGYARLVNGATDIGAYEVQESTPPASLPRPIPWSVPPAPLPVAAEAAASTPSLPLSQAVAAADRVFASQNVDGRAASWIGYRHESSV